MSTDLPELPLGLSLRQHLVQYVSKFVEAEAKWLEAIELAKEKDLPEHQATCELVLATIESIRTELADILRFTEAESGFYVSSGAVPPGSKSILVRHPALGQDGNWYVPLQLCTGDRITESVRFDLDAAETIATAIGVAVAEARSK